MWSFTGCYTVPLRPVLCRAVLFIPLLLSVEGQCASLGPGTRHGTCQFQNVIYHVNIIRLFLRNRLLIDTYIAIVLHKPWTSLNFAM
jgi:hypothetical protein